MKPHECEDESRVIEAARSDRWDAGLRRHVSQCETCGGAALAARLLNEMRAADEAEPRIPDAGLVWWKAQLLARQEAAERATQPINFVERLAYFWVALGVGGACVWQWPAIRAWLEALGSYVSGPFSAAISSWASTSAYVQGPGLLLAVSAGIFLAFVVFAAYFALSEE